MDRNKGEVKAFSKKLEIDFSANKRIIVNRSLDWMLQDEVLNDTISRGSKILLVILLSFLHLLDKKQAIMGTNEKSEDEGGASTRGKQN